MPNVTEYKPLLASKAQDTWIATQRKYWYANEARLKGMDVKEYLNSNAALPQYIWKEWDTTGLEIRRSPNSIYNMLNSAVGRNVPVGISVHEFRQISDSDHRGVFSLDGEQRPNYDSPINNYVPTPIPFYANAFGYSFVEWEAAQNSGFNDLDTTAANNAMYHTMRDLDNVCLVGVDNIKYGSTTLQGLVNHSKRNTVSKSVTNLNGATGAEWKQEVIKIVKAATDDNVYTDVTLIANFDDWRFAENTDYSDQYAAKTIGQRVREIAGVANVFGVKNPNIPANTIVAVALDMRNVEVLSRLPMTTIPMFRTHPHSKYEFEIWASAAVEVKYDLSDQVGLVHYS